MLAALLAATLAGQAAATGPGGWDHLGLNGSGGSALNGAVYALNADRPGTLYVGGNFTAAGGVAGADRIASWNGSAWSAVSSPASQISNGAVNAIAYDAATGDVFAGGTFTNAGGDPNADFLAKWDGTSWAPFCNPTTSPPSITATVYALQIVGRTLYVAGAFADGAGIASADRVLACNLDTGASSSTVVDAAHEFTGTVYALTADSNGTLYAGGGFTDLEGQAAADNVAYRDGTGWHAMGSGGGSCSCAVPDFVRSLTAVGTDVYVGTDATDVAGIAKADHVARWNGSAWSAVGANSADTDGWFPASAFIYGLAHEGNTIYATGSFQNADGDPRADFIASFDGSAWHPVGSDGAGQGPWSGNGLAVASFNGKLVAGGNFTSAGGDPLAQYIARFPGDYVLNVGRNGTGGGEVTVNGTACGHDHCTYEYPPGTTVTLSWFSQLDATFTGWSGGGCTGTEGCQITLNADTTITGNFDAIPGCSSIGGYTATGGEPVQLQLRCEDRSGNPITYGILALPGHGTLGPLSATGAVTYTPTVGFTGSDYLRYNGSASDGVSREAIASINVTNPGYSHAGDKIALALSKLTPNAAGQLSLAAHNGNSFAVQAVSLEVTSASPSAGGKRRARPKATTFLKSAMKTTIAAGKTAKLKGRLSERGLALLKQKGHVRVQVRVVLKAPGGTRASVTGNGTLRAPN